MALGIAIEEVYWRHRIWPKENLNPKPSLDPVMSQAQVEAKVTDYPRKSQALEDFYKNSAHFSNYLPQSTPSQSDLLPYTVASF